VCIPSGGSLDPDMCTECHSGYERNQDVTNCVMNTSTSKAKNIAYLIFMMIGLEILVTILYIIFSKGSFNGILLMIMLAQNLVFLNLFDASLPTNIISFLKEISDVLFQFNYMSRGPFEISYPGCNQYDRKLNLCVFTQLVGLESRSSWNILTIQFFGMILLLVFQGITTALYFRAKKAKQVDEDSQALEKIQSLMNFATFSIYIPFFQLNYMIMMVSSVTELGSCFYNDGIQGGSCFYASLVWAGCTAVLGIVQWQFFKSQYNYTFLRMKFFTQLFKGLRLNWKSRSQPFIYFARIYLFTIMTTIGIIKNLDFTIFATILQIMYLILTCVSFPFSQYKYNFICILNEFIFTVSMILVIRSKRHNGLSSTIESAFFNMILFTFAFAILASVGGIISLIVKKTCGKYVTPKIDAKHNLTYKYSGGRMSNNQLEASRISDNIGGMERSPHGGHNQPNNGFDSSLQAQPQRGISKVNDAKKGPHF